MLLSKFYFPQLTPNTGSIVDSELLFQEIQALNAEISLIQKEISNSSFIQSIDMFEFVSAHDGNLSACISKARETLSLLNSSQPLSDSRMFPAIDFFFESLLTWKTDCELLEEEQFKRALLEREKMKLKLCYSFLQIQIDCPEPNNDFLQVVKSLTEKQIDLKLMYKEAELINTQLKELINMQIAEKNQFSIIKKDLLAELSRLRDELNKAKNEQADLKERLEIKESAEKTKKDSFYLKMDKIKEITRKIRSNREYLTRPFLQSVVRFLDLIPSSYPKLTEENILNQLDFVLSYYR